MSPIYAFMGSFACVGAGLFLALKEKKQLLKLQALELFDEEVWEEKKKKNASSMLYLALGAIAISVSGCIAIFFRPTVPAIVIPGMLTYAVGVLVHERVRAYRVRVERESIEYYVPIVMERIVMAVESGLDIIPAITTVITLEEKAAALRKKEVDPVTKHFIRIMTLVERGVPFNQALSIASEGLSSLALQHACVHLGIAFLEGGELMQPLRELSDATQLQYQDCVEEEIAKLPVKATLPLVLTFAGLMTFFLASPLIQILSFATRMTPK